MYSKVIYFVSEWFLKEGLSWNSNSVFS